MSVLFLSYPTHPLQVSLALIQTEKCPLKLHKEVISKKEKILFRNDSVTSLQGDGIALLDHCEASRAFLSNFFHQFPKIEITEEQGVLNRKTKFGIKYLDRNFCSVGCNNLSRFYIGLSLVPGILSKFYTA